MGREGRKDRLGLGSGEGSNVDLVICKSKDVQTFTSIDLQNKRSLSFLGEVRYSCLVEQFWRLENHKQVGSSF